MSMKDLERIKSKRTDLDDAPRFITPDAIISEIREDPNHKDKQECLYCDFHYVEGKFSKVVTQKYTPFHIKVLMKRMKLMKIKAVDKWINKPWKLEHEAFGGIGYAHYLPVQTEDESE